MCAKRPEKNVGKLRIYPKIFLLRLEPRHYNIGIIKTHLCIPVKNEKGETQMAVKASERVQRYVNANGPTIGTVERKVLSQDGLYFKDIAGTGTSTTGAFPPKSAHRLTSRP